VARRRRRGVYMYVANQYMLEPEPEPEPEPEVEVEVAAEVEVGGLGGQDSSSSLDGYNWDEDMLFGANPPPLQVLGAYSELPAFEMDEFEPPIRCAALPAMFALRCSTPAGKV
jgi:hypothetical protein